VFGKRAQRAYLKTFRQNNRPLKSKRKILSETHV
jgi:hypothetical protein